MLTKPMLAADAGDISKLIYPRIASPKLDGIRCLKVGGRALSRSFKRIPNAYIRTLIEASPLPDGVDGELILRGSGQFNSVSSAVMSESGTPDFVYMIFDWVVNGNKEEPFIARYCRLQNELKMPGDWAQVLHHIEVNDAEELAFFEDGCIRLGNEGVITRTLDSPYKCGRSTLREQYMLKVKRFVDSEAYIIGMVEMERNNNPAFEGELGQTKRSTCQYGMVLAGTLGALIVKDVKTGIVHNIGSGFTQAERDSLWKRKDELVNSTEWLVTYKFQPHGVVVKPRSPIYKGLRHREDL